ncbi:mitochondrial zinc maintenance protein 1, mitochondrial-like [Selaginella moellendorffii]|uniref:mitochondrial zinc maintenance protein 1, mitochondrial-like n=1 Tax=Selaginella moellendorffii TaxID=88036 RepID=UPI000D1C5FCC|nr:mitochondrial zinc maintenance protein 1, mitochondrial-like [Selaginella moellendorffii]|eukprot:XP_024535103.1 mitochondrial zinc maintenance protein 1, mitochondrial-like [Selaginella moellendorffii]
MAEARSVMRALLRARKVAFKDDKPMIDAAAKHVRSIFEERRRVSDPVELEKNLQEGREAAQYLVENVIQAKRNSQGHYAMGLKKEHMGMEFEGASR